MLASLLALLIISGSIHIASAVSCATEQVDVTTEEGQYNAANAALALCSAGAVTPYCGGGRPLNRSIGSAYCGAGNTCQPHGAACTTVAGAGTCLDRNNASSPFTEDACILP